MHDSSAKQPGDAQPGRAGDSALPVPAAGSSGDLTVFERLQAFRELIRHGHALLGEVVVYCRDAEAAVAQLAEEKASVDQLRHAAAEAQARAADESQAARQAIAAFDVQRRELADLRTELVNARAAMAEVQRGQAGTAEALERSLREAKQQQAQLEDELRRVQACAASTQALDARLQQIDQMEAKLKLTERELSETRRALDDERSRRDRAIALIKPRAVAT